MTKLITETKDTFGTLSSLLKQCERARPDQAGSVALIRADLDEWATAFGELMATPSTVPDPQQIEDSIDDVA